MKYPHMREELLRYLGSLSSLQYQKSCWVSGICPAGVEHDEFDLAVHFLFDDTSLSDEPEKLIGIILRNKSEADAVKAVCASIDFVLSRYGTDLNDGEYIAVPEWLDVVNSASSALQKLSAPEEKRGVTE